ncbi:MAG TPA: phosphoglycerate dehydrogenase [Ktedonobacterales bacterium]|jgi:D-3-phosphoglycerate dehydrogenase|nr:phosphoglycerate dehydrogenase [Ktedonobacterales bacterium]
MTDQQSQRPRILVADPIATEGLDILRSFADVDVRTGLGAEGLVAAIPPYDGLVVRSETKVTAAAIDAGSDLRIIARAGVGVDNIDVEAATRRGVVVVNSPTGNIVAAAEHSVALLLAMARRIPIANEALRQGRWERSKFVGAEVRGKTLGIVGLGKVGTEVARRAGENGLGMRLLAHDPYASPDNARLLNVELVSLDELLEQSDFVTLHTVLNAGTRGLVSVDELAKMKPTARIINCARGGVVDEEALLDALKEGRLAGAALDVFTTEPPFTSPTLEALIARPDVVVTPHLGASTEEAQVSVAVDVAEQMRDVFRGGAPRAAVNAPLILPETLRQLEPWMALVEKLGRIYTQLHPGALKRVEFSVAGEIAQFDTRPLTTALIKGLLEPVSETYVNLVNAQVVAREWGMEVVESRSTTHEQYANLVTVRVSPDGVEAEQHVLAGTVAWGEERIVRVDRYLTDFAPRAHLLLARNLDRPGMIGVVGVILGDAGVNIAHMDVGPVALGDAAGRTRQPGGEALMALSLDDAVPEAALDKIRHADGIMDVRSVEL